MSATAAIANPRSVPRVAPRLEIGHWRNTFVVPEDFLRRSATHDVLRRIDCSIVEELPESCALRLGDCSGDSPEGVWLIRELNLNFTVDLSKRGAGDIAPAWSNQLAARLAQTIHRGPDADDGVLYFPNRAAYLAQFILDLISGRAWSKWYYEEFQSLAILSSSRAIAEVLTREPEVGLRTLVHLAEAGRIDEALQVLTAADARTIDHSCFPAIVPADSRSAAASPWIGRLLEIWQNEPSLSAGVLPSIYHHALRWLALMSVRFRDLEIDAVACSAVAELLELRRVLLEMNSPFFADRLVRELVEGTISLGAAIERASQKGTDSPARALGFLVAAAAGDSDWAVQAAAVLLKEHMPPGAAVLTGESMVSNFAAMFLLGPALLPVNEFLREAIAQGEIDQHEQPQDGLARKARLDQESAEQIAGFLRYLILVKCAGSARAFDATCDPALRLLSGCPQLSVREGLLACPSFDLDRACKFLLRTLTPADDGDTRFVLAETIARQAQGRELVLLRELLGSMSRETYSSMLDASERLSYFSFANLWQEFDLTLDLFGSLLSRAVMGQFASRLMGFQASSPEHLWRNFLEGAGTVRNLADRIEVELPRSPLLLVLQLSGLSRQSYFVPWLEGKEVCLLPPKE